MVALDRQEPASGWAYLARATGEVQVPSLADFDHACGEIRHLRAREVVVGYCLSEDEQQVLSKQMNLLLSEV